MGITKKAFTFIEIVVVIGVISISLPVLFTIIFAITNQTLKVQRLSEVKKQGDYAINVMENIIRSYAVKIYSEDTLTNEQCTTVASTYPSPASSDGKNFFIEDKSNESFSFQISNFRIASNSSVLASDVFLMSDKIRIDNFAIQCNRKAVNSLPIISISFDICYKNPSSGDCIFTRKEETASLYYQTKIKLRNY